MLTTLATVYVLWRKKQKSAKVRVWDEFPEGSILTFQETHCRILCGKIQHDSFSRLTELRFVMDRQQATACHI